MRKTQLPTPLPVQQFARCIDDRDRPADFIGEWPQAGRVYPVHTQRHATTGERRVRVLGFYCEAPHGAFAAQRFEPVATLWMN